MSDEGRRIKEYFSHDYAASRDPKLMRLLAKHGNEGYGIFWRIVERLYEAGGRLQADTDSLAYDLRADAAVVKSILEGFDLFHVAGDSIGSSSVDRRLEERWQKASVISDKRREAGKIGNAIRWGNSKDSSQTIANASQNVASDRICKVKEKVKEHTTDSAPSPSDSPPQSPAFLAFECIKDLEWVLTEAKVAEYQTTYPALDVKAECRKAWQWLKDRPANRKTVSGMPKFLSGWLGRSQNNSRPQTTGAINAPRIAPNLLAHD